MIAPTITGLPRFRAHATKAAGVSHRSSVSGKSEAAINLFPNALCPCAARSVANGVTLHLRDFRSTRSRRRIDRHSYWSDPDGSIPCGRVNRPTKKGLVVQIRRYRPSDLDHQRLDLTKGRLQLPVHCNRPNLPAGQRAGPSHIPNRLPRLINIVSIDPVSRSHPDRRMPGTAPECSAVTRH
jgi:hypothetical protein